ncbi:hypothetical protein EV182_005320, partial [Spiromyces aspiralis]
MGGLTGPRNRVELGPPGIHTKIFVCTSLPRSFGAHIEATFSWAQVTVVFGYKSKFLSGYWVYIEYDAFKRLCVIKDPSKSDKTFEDLIGFLERLDDACHYGWGGNPRYANHNPKEVLKKTLKKHKFQVPEQFIIDELGPLNYKDPSDPMTN